MANDENKIILEFPATNVEIEFGETITFDNISGFLNSDRVTYNGESLTEEIAHLENDKADETYVDTELAKKADKTNTYTKSQVDNALNNKMDKANPTGTGRIAVGQGVVASGAGSQAFGVSSTASGLFSHAEGFATTASGEASHAEGYLTTASGQYSHSEGCQTIASGRSQHVSGKYNVVDNNNTYAEIIGNGESQYARSNARTLDWSGNETLAGNLTFNGNKSLTSEISRLDGRIDDLPEPMVFKGTLGVGGTIESLPTASAENEGWTFKCITAGTYEGLTLKVGDTVTCFNPPNTSVYEWDISGHGDTDTDTWRAIKVNGVEKLGNGISSGAVDFVGSENIEVDFDGNGNKVGIKTKNIYTKNEVDDIVYNILPDDTASGSVANFETDLALPLKSLEIDVNAVQDLHGYDNPWPAGGGKNLFDVDACTPGYLTSTGKSISDPYKENLVSDFISVVENQTYSYTSYPTTHTEPWIGWCFYTEKNMNTAVEIAPEKYRDVSNTETKQITVPSGAKYIRIGARYLDNGGNAQFEKGSTATSFAPYSNICPISGWNEIRLVHCGTNLWDEEWELGYYSSTGAKVSATNQLRTTNKIMVKPNTDYYFKIPVSGYNAFTVIEYDEKGEFLRGVTPSSYSGDGAIYTTSSDCHYFNINIGSSYGNVYLNNISINYPSTDTAYHAYNGTTEVINLGGTYYGGVLDVIRGKITLTWGVVDLSTCNWRLTSSRAMTNDVASLIKPSSSSSGLSNTIAEKFYEVPSDFSLNTWGQFAVLSDGRITFYRDNETPTGLMVYPLATPIEVQLTPQQIEAFIGTNNIYAGSGDTSVVFKDSVNGYVEKKIASVQALTLNT